MRREIKTRCAALEQLFQLCATRTDTKQVEKQSAIVRRYAVSSEGHLYVLLERISKRNSCSNTELTHLRAITLMLDRLLVFGASFAAHNNFEAVNPARLQCISEAIVAAEEGNLEKVRGILCDPHLCDPQTPVPEELDQIERTLRRLADSRQSNAAEATAEGPAEGPQVASSSRSSTNCFTHLLLPDAFTNYDYFIYALKLSVCATICYVFYNGVRWPGIGTAIYFTVYFTGLSTTGASNRKLLFRAIGSAIGGLVLGIACLAFAFPNIEGVPIIPDSYRGTGIPRRMDRCQPILRLHRFADYVCLQPACVRTV